MPTPGTWLRNDYQGMPYYVLRPASYSEAASYPVILHLHQYQADSGQPAQADPWYNTAAFRDAHPCIVVLPLCVIGNQRSTPTFNWGGVDMTLQQPIVSALAILDLVVTQYGCDRNRLYVTGNSMGGLGTWGILCNPGQRSRFAAAMPVSGSCYYQIGNEAAIASALKGLPIWSCHGAQDSQVSPAFDQAIMPLVIAANPASRFTNPASGGHDTWDTFYPDPNTWTWLFSQHKGGVPLPASADRTTIVAGSSNSIADTAGNTWTISALGQVVLNGFIDTSTSNVVQLVWVGGLLWQQNAAGNWYSKSPQGGAWSSPATVNPLAPPPAFSIRGGQIIGPDGKPWVAAGINNRPMNAGNAGAILQMFPGISFVRLAMDGFEDPASWAGFVGTMEKAGVVCLKEYHPWPMLPARSGADLAAEAASAGRWASYYKGRPYVWVGSMNEPQSGDMTPEHVAVYNAVRAADPTKMVVFVAGIGGGNPGATGGRVLNAAAYAKMTNIVWDLHFYGWATKYSTDQAACNAALLGSVASASGIAACKAVISADGEVPVIIAEFGPSTSGAATDANAAQIIKAVVDATTAGRAQGYAGWSWNADPYNALQNGAAPTAWGRTLAASIATTTAKQVPPPPPPPPPGPTLADLVKRGNAAVTELSAVMSGLGKLSG